MKEMIKRVKENKGGFTLAELLIVVAIILVLVAIAIPVFMGAQDTATRATREANIRAVKSATMVHVLEENIALGTGNTVYRASGTIAPNGDITITTVTPAASAGTDSLGTGDTDTTGAFVISLTPTALPAPATP